MGVPAFTAMLEPLLLVLGKEGQGLAARIAQDLVAASLGLTEEDRLLRLPNGTQLLYRHRTNWAHDRLKRAGMSSCPRRGVWQLTAQGLRLAADTSLRRLSLEDLRTIAKAGRDQRLADVMQTAGSDEAEPLPLNYSGMHSHGVAVASRGT